MQTADELFATVEGEAAYFAAAGSMTVDDVRQTLYLFCLEHARGVDNYNALLGEVRTYIMGRMWGLLQRWKGRELPLDSEIEREDHRVIPLSLCSPAVDLVLIEAEQRRVMEAVLKDRDQQGRLDRARLPTAVTAICGQGLAARAMEQHCGGGSRQRTRWRQTLKEHEARLGLTSHMGNWS